MLDIFWTVLFSGLAAIFKLSVGTGGLQISLGIIVLIICLQQNKKLPVILTSFLTGIAVFIVRVIMAFFIGASMTLTVHNVLALSLEILFYLGYSVIYLIIVRNDKSQYKNPLILLLLLCDFGANTIEYVVRYFYFSTTLEVVDFQTIFLAAFIRSAIIWAVSKYVFRLEET